MHVHENQTASTQRLKDKGWVAVETKNGWTEWVDPNAICLHTLRTGPCRMPKGHRGRHTTVVFFCDSCCKTRRGSPYRSNEDADFCFMCFIPPNNWGGWE